MVHLIALYKSPVHHARTIRIVLAAPPTDLPQFGLQLDHGNAVGALSAVAGVAVFANTLRRSGFRITTEVPTAVFDFLQKR